MTGLAKAGRDRMKVKIEAECSPEEARAFLGLPDVTVLNDHLVNEMKTRLDANIAAIQPEELMKTWTSFGLQAQDQFRQIMAMVTQVPKV